MVKKINFGIISGRFKGRNNMKYINSKGKVKDLKLLYDTRNE